jgi:hypothetical protein
VRDVFCEMHVHCSEGDGALEGVRTGQTLSAREQGDYGRVERNVCDCYEVERNHVGCSLGILEYNRQLCEVKM